MLTKTDVSRRGSGDAQVLGAMLVIVGVGWLLHRAGVVEADWRTVLSAVLVALGLGLVFTARRSGAGLVIVGIVLTLVLAASSSTPKFDWNWNRDFQNFGGPDGPSNFGDQTTPLAVLPEGGYRLRHTGGDINLDLTSVAPYSGTRTVDVNLGVGDLVISLPSTVKIQVDAHVGAGDMHILNRPPSNGFGLNSAYTDPGFEDAEQQLVIHARVGGGSIHITRAPAE